MASFRVVHRTIYQFGGAVERCSIRALLRPRETAWQGVAHAAVATVPLPRSHDSELDRFGNHVDRMRLDETVHRLEVIGHSVVTLLERGRSGDGVLPDPATFADPSPGDAPAREAAIWAWAARQLPDRFPSADHAAALMAQIRRDFAYDPSASHVGDPLATLFARCRGACQDFTRLAIACLRARGVPCRYIVGYADPTAGIRPPTLSHAWLAAWFPDRAWVEFDPTNGIDPAGRHIVLGWGRDQEDVQPVAGDLGGVTVRQRLTVDVTVMPA